MIFYGEDSWKKKIDPAFDKPVKRWIKHLSKVEELPDGWQIKFPGCSDMKMFRQLKRDMPITVLKV